MHGRGRRMKTANIGIAHYGITKRTDFRGLVSTGDWDSGYPLMIYGSAP